MSTQVTLRGRLVKEPEIRFSQKGNAVARFTIVTARRFKDQASGEWKEDSVSFWDCVAFGQLAENVAEQDKGTALIVVGNSAQEQWTDKEGQSRRSWKVTCEDVAPSLRWVSAKVSRTDRSQPQAGNPAPDDPWAGDATDDRPPF